MAPGSRHDDDGSNGDAGNGSGDDAGTRPSCVYAGWPAVPSPTTGSQPTAITTGDFDRDGNLDMAVAN